MLRKHARTAAVALVSALLVPARGLAADLAPPPPSQETTPPRAAAPTGPSATTANLAAAHEADVHAGARYLAFSEQADREGYRQAARVFRAAARSEEIRASRHADALRGSGGAPTAAAAPPIEVRGTRQNLLWTMAHEGAERAATYPRYVQQARRDGQSQAVLTFSEAHRVEAELIRLYQQTLANLEGTRRDGDALHVCRDCGHVVRGPPPEQCAVSLSDAAAFEAVD